MIVPALVNKGPVIVAKDLCTQYIKWGHKCTVFYFDENVELDFPCPTIKIGMWEKYNFSEFDIVHSHQYRPDAYVYFHKLYKQNVILISTLHQHIEQQLKFDNSRNKIFNLLGCYSWFYYLKSFDHVVSLTSFHESYYKRKGLKTSIISNGRYVNTLLDADEIDKFSIIRLKSKYRLMATVAYVTIRKGLDQLLYAMKDDSRYALMLVGDGPDLHRLQEIAKELAIIDRCLFVGNKDDGYRYLKYADLFVLCSYAEGFPLALIEASAYGLPVVSSDIEAITSVMENGEVEFYRLSDIDSLKRAINDAYVNRESLSACIKQKYISCFSVEAMANKYIHLYKNLLNEK